MNITDLNGFVKLNNGVKMPYIGLGVYKTKDGQEVIDAVTHALKSGYRHIDTAAYYKNEAGVGEAIRNSGIPREEIFVTSKVWNADQGYESTIKAFEYSLEQLGFEYLDLYLIHWPVAGKYKETWKALEHLYKQGKIRAIGVSNFLQSHLEDLLVDCDVRPMVNQMEFHPRLVQQSLIDFCVANKIQYEAWSPLMQGHVFEEPLIASLAKKYNKTIAQLIIRWNLQKGVVTIPKSVTPSRIEDNVKVFDFEISSDDMHTLDSLDKGKRFGPDPGNFDF